MFCPSPSRGHLMIFSFASKIWYKASWLVSNYHRKKKSLRSWHFKRWLFLGANSKSEHCVCSGNLTLIWDLPKGVLRCHFVTFFSQLVACFVEGNIVGEDIAVTLSRHCITIAFFSVSSCPLPVFWKKIVALFWGHVTCWQNPLEGLLQVKN